MTASKAVGIVILAGAGFMLWRNRAEAAPAPAPEPAVMRQTGLQKLAQFAPLISWGFDQVNWGQSSQGGSRTEGGAAQPDTGNLVARVWDALRGGGGMSGSTGATASPQGASAVVQASYGGIPAFGPVEQAYGLPTGYLQRTAQIESSMNPRAQNPRSSAGGLFQFIDSTARQYGLRDRFDPVEATDAAARLARDNQRYLRGQLGRNPTAAELYLAHQQGAGGAARLLRNPNGRAVDTVGAAAIRLNGGHDGMTNQQFANLWLNKFNRGA